MGGDVLCLAIRPQRRTGFTLVEIMLVVVILMILASVVVPRMINSGLKARIAATKVSMNGLRTALGQFAVNVGRLPTTEEGLAALVTRPSDVPLKVWGDKYLDGTPEDAWGHEFKYACPSEHDKDYDLTSAGPDGKFGTGDDITNYAEAEAPQPK